MECPLRSNGDTRIFEWHSLKENGETHLWYLHKDDGVTQDICVTFIQRKWESSTQKKTQNGVAVQKHNGNLWNKRKQGGL